MSNPLNYPNNTHTKTFVESDANHTPLNNGRGLDLTIASKKDSFSSYNPNVKPNGRRMIDGHEVVMGERDIWSYEGGRNFTGKQTKGRVLVPSNHPNTKLNKIYG